MANIKTVSASLVATIFIIYLQLTSHSTNPVGSEDLHSFNSIPRITGNNTCPSIEGEWVRRSPSIINKTHTQSQCCGYDICARNQGHSYLGSDFCIDKYIGYDSRKFYSGNPDSLYITPAGGRACCCEGFIDEYDWQAPNLVNMSDPVETCHLLKNRTVMLIGDSTMGQTASALMNYLRHGNCQTKVTHALSDTLVGEKFYGNKERGKYWKDIVDDANPSIVIVTVGAHIYEDNNITYLDVVDVVLGEMLKMQRDRDITFAWKTQNAGGCTEDIVSPRNSSLATLNIMNISEGHYNWGQFPERDCRLIERLQNLGIPYLDMRMLYSRSDAHPSSKPAGKKFRDCLHTCSPGPLDIIGRLFHQLLITIDSYDKKKQ